MRKDECCGEPTIVSGYVREQNYGQYDSIHKWVKHYAWHCRVTRDHNGHWMEFGSD